MFRDVFGKEIDLSKKKLWLFDMDGTIYKEDVLYDGTLELLDIIEKQGGRYIFITNNSSRSVVDYIAHNGLMGIKSGLENYFTSTQATISFLKENYTRAKIYCLGTMSLIDELKRGGLDITENVEPVDVVLAGFDNELTSVKLRKTCQILTEQDVDFIATNPDLACPVSFGFVPDCGSICKMLENATGKSPIYIGKPEPTMVNTVMKKYGCSREETVVIGDRLYTDIKTGINAGVTSICVLTGEASIETIRKGNVKPTYTLNSVKDIYEIIRDEK